MRTRERIEQRSRIGRAGGSSKQGRGRVWDRVRVGTG